MDAAAVEYKVLDAAFDGEMLGHLRSAVLLHQHGEAREVQPATSLSETQAAVRALLARGLVAIVRDGIRLSEKDGEAVASAAESWEEPECWQYEVVVTEAGEAAVVRLDAERSAE